MKKLTSIETAHQDMEYRIDIIPNGAIPVRKGVEMLKHNDYLEAIRRFKNKKENAHARQRYHALLLVTKGYGFRETADILFLDEETVSRWVQSYQQQGLDGLKNNPLWGGEHGQRQLNDAELATLSSRLETTAMPGTRVGSGWTLKAIYDLVVEQFAVFY